MAVESSSSVVDVTVVIVLPLMSVKTGTVVTVEGAAVCKNMKISSQLELAMDYLPQVRVLSWSFQSIGYAPQHVLSAQTCSGRPHRRSCRICPIWWVE